MRSYHPLLVGAPIWSMPHTGVLRSSGQFVLSNISRAPKRCPRRRIGEFFGLSQLYGRIAGQRVAICCRNYYVSLQPRRRDRQMYLFGCSNAPVTFKSKDAGRCCFLSAAAMGRDHISLPMYLPASFVTTAANVATPRNTVLQHAGAG
jgi:hypothetical protein